MRDPRHPGWPEQGERTEFVEVAERWKWAYLDWCRDRTKRRQLGEVEARTIGAAVEEYLAHRDATRSPQTVRNDRAALTHLLDDVRPYTSVHAVNPQKTLDRLVRDGLAVSTVRGYSKFLSSFWSWLDLPYKVRLPSAQKTDVHAWTNDEVTAIRQMADRAGLLLEVDTGLFMGLRRREIWGLEWEDLDRASWIVRVRRQYPDAPLKGKRARTAVILPGWDHKGGQGRVVVQSFASRSTLFRTHVLKPLGLWQPGLNWHSLRDTYARLFLEAKPDMRLLQASLGHDSVVTTERSYDTLLPDRAAELAREAIHGRL